jgi:sialic acid synthase SpsE
MTYVIAEAGVNHNGDLHTAKRLVDVAKVAGADAVKFQMFDSFRLWGDDRLSSLQLSELDMEEVAKHCVHNGIEFLCTPFGVPEVSFLAPLVKRFKIASGCIGRKDLLDAVRVVGLPVILSTGMSYQIEVARALSWLAPLPITLLHCTSAYPCPLDQVNLAAMEALKAMGHPVGYSDHTHGIVISLAAAAKGATVIEKHLTLDRNAPGPDHKSSIEPEEFRIMVEAIRMIEKAEGVSQKVPQPAELALRKVWRDD